MEILALLKSRKLFAQVTHDEELEEHFASGKQTVYLGIDPTADSLTVGHLVPIMGLRWLQQAGHRVVLVMGGGTGHVGDPTGKTEMRKMLDAQALQANIDSQLKQVGRILDLEDSNKTIVVNNFDWLSKPGYLEFIQEIGVHFSVNRMLTADCFKSRLEKGLSFLEFNYMLLQSYDFLHLYREYGCTVQIGGDDQWSNMLGGVELIRRAAKGKSWCLTVPLLTTSDGRKMGKTEGGAVWLDPEKTPVFDFFQYWRNVEDAVVEKCLLSMTEVPADEIVKWTQGDGADINFAKERLAFEMTAQIHGREESDKALAAAKSLFSGGKPQGEVPELEFANPDGLEDIGVLDLTVQVGLFPSKGEARRMVKQGGLTIDGVKISDPNQKVKLDDLKGEDKGYLRKGKKHYYRLVFR